MLAEGLPMVEMARESLSMALALEEYGAMKADKHEQLRKDFTEKYSGLENALKHAFPELIFRI
jgi:hypothetical protein